MSIEDKLTTILIQIGETKGKVTSICEDLAYVKRQINDLVSKEDCAIARKSLNEICAKSMVELQEELANQLPDLIKNAISVKDAKLIPCIESEDLAKIITDRAETRRKLFAWYLGTGAIIVGLVSTCGIAAYKISVSVDKMYTSVQAQPDLIKNEVERITCLTRSISNTDFKSVNTIKKEHDLQSNNNQVPTCAYKQIISKKATQHVVKGSSNTYAK